MALISGALSDDTPAYNRHRDFLAARTLVCGSADSNWYPSAPGFGMAGQQAPSEVGLLSPCSLLPPAHLWTLPVVS